jgi:glucan biosynthesis protein C
MKNLAETSSRLYYLDWLRVLAMVGVFLFHNARFFDVFSDWHVKNATTSFGASVLVAFLDQWAMPLFFLIAGAGTYYALKSRRAGRYIQERTLRLVIPLIFGMLVIVVPQAYFQALSHGEQLGGYNFFQLYGLYLQTLPDLEWFHLWFLVDLFLFSIITVPIFITIGASGKSVISRLATVFDRPWALVLLLVFLIAIVNVFFYPAGFWGNRNGGFNIVAYLLFFIFGYLIFANPRIMEVIEKMRWIMLGVGVIAILSAVAFFVDELADPIKYFGTPRFIIAHFIQSLDTWCWLLAILGLGSRFLNRNNRFLSYANEAVLPFYILHQTVIISIGFYVVQWNTGVELKYLTISTTSFIAIMLIYEFLVRRINALRFLFGMRIKRKPLAELAMEGQI